MSQTPVVAILGASFSGNKGAASMAYAVADGVRARVPGARVRVFSPYPADDRRLRPDADLVDFTPRDMLLRVLPAAVACLLTGRRARPRRGPAGALARADVVADVSGIAFMDGRGAATLAYNVLLVALPWALGVPVVKVAQALGPFEHRANRLAARATLRRAHWVGLRGEGTARNVAALGLGNAEPAADVAFLLEAGQEAERAAAAELPTPGQVTLVAPSAVVEQACAREGGDYVARMARLVDGLAGAGHEVALVAHSARGTAGAGRTNDLPVSRRIAEASGTRLLDREIDARELRALIGRSRLLVTSRFHGMVSGLATATPTFVIGWSHKYREVLERFGLAEWAVDFQGLDDDALVAAVLRLDDEADKVRAAIARALPDVAADAERNIDRLVDVLEAGQR